MERNMSTGAESIDWADPAFNTAEFQDAMLGESPWGNSALNDFTNLADYSDSPAAFNLRTPSKSGLDAPTPASAQQHPPTLAKETSMSADSSSADSGSESSSKRKRKVTSESPLSNAGLGNVVPIKEELAMNNQFENIGAFQQTLTQPMPRLAVDQDMGNSESIFDFNSAASSPNLPRDFNQQLSLDASKSLLSSNNAAFSQNSPVQTINPGMFTIGPESRDQSPAANSTMFNTASPNAMFSTPSSDNDTFGSGQNWSTGMSQNPAWPPGFGSLTSPSGLSFTPSPAANGGTPTAVARSTAIRLHRSPLHIAPISAKSRVETQINVVMTLEEPPPGIEHLHLPLHTIAKSKLLAKEEYEPSKVLELHTMLVCSSAMHNPSLKEKAMQRAAAQNNDEIQRRAEVERESGDDEKNNIKNLEESEKPSNGGEVRICSNCIQRERKRAGRKKLKKEEEQQHWERYETERVVVFNSSEYLPFKPFEHRDQPQKEGALSIDEPYEPPPGAISASAAMRIACYCRHQSEKEGFQVIFTLKDQSGHVVAQEISDSILITDDHKTHPSSMNQVSNEMLFQSGPLSANGMPTSYSMMDLASHSAPFTSSRSAGNLQALGYGTQLQFNPHSHVHQLPNTGLMSQGTSAAMTPTNLSRPGSPTSAGQQGPNKKRKSASFHKRVPSGLQMTPRVDTTPNQPSSATLSAGLNMANFSPTPRVLSNLNNQSSDPSYMTIPNNNGPAQYYGSGPPTPANENQGFQLGQPHQLDIARAQNSAYFSHPSSAVPSRSNSPVLPHSRPALSAYPRMIQTPTNQLNRQAPMYGAQTSAGAGSNDNDQAAAPTITKITPTEGPVVGGTEVSIFGYNFTHATQIMFGDNIAPTTFYGSQSILAISPPGRPGQVRVKLVPAFGSLQYSSTQSNNPIFEYKDTNPQMMELALRFLSQQQTGDPGRWAQYTNDVANQFMQTSISQAGLTGQGFGGGNMLAHEAMNLESTVLKVLDMVDASESPRPACYDIRSANGQTMLSLSCASGLHQVTAALLARGANPDVRDDRGYTPLMQAALHERLKTFQLLLIKGADPTIRSLTGYTAIDFVPTGARDSFFQILQNTQRNRSARPSFRRLGSHTSTKSWDIASASFYESEFESSEHLLLSQPASRRPSENMPGPGMDETESESAQPTSLAAMNAWRDALASQIYQFQQSVHSSMSTFQLPSLPPLPDYQDHPMVRRLSSLVPGRTLTRGPQHEVAEDRPQSQHPYSRFWDMFSCSSPASPPPPAYSELYPDSALSSVVDDATKKSGAHTAVVDAIADKKCRMLFEEQPRSKLDSALLAPQLVRSCSLNKATIHLWFSMTLLVLTASTVLQLLLLPETSMRSAQEWVKGLWGGPFGSTRIGRQVAGHEAIGVA